MIKALLIAVLIQTAYASTEEFYRVGDTTHRFTLVDGIWVSGNCDNKKCEAYEKGKKYREQKVDPQLLTGGKNPFSVSCKTLMKGSVIIAKDLEKNDQSICSFSDGSYLILN